MQFTRIVESITGYFMNATRQRVSTVVDLITGLYHMCLSLFATGIPYIPLHKPFRVVVTTTSSSTSKMPICAENRSSLQLPNTSIISANDVYLFPGYLV